MLMDEEERRLTTDEDIREKEDGDEITSPLKK